MKVLHVVDSLNPGGAQRIIKDLLESDSAQEMGLFVLRTNKIQLKIDIDPKRIYVCKNKSKFSFSQILRLAEYISKQDVEVLHCHLFKSSLFCLILKFFYFKSIKIVFHEHGQIFQKNNYYVKFLKLSEKYFDFYIAVSELVKKQLIIFANTDAKKILVLDNYHTFTKGISKKSKSIDETFNIGFIGRLEKIKGCDVLINAVKDFCFRNKVYVFGEGSERSKLLALINNKNMSDNVKLKGFASNMQENYENLDIIVIPSYSEASPMVLFEAMAHGIPVVVSDILSLRNYLHDESECLFFNPGDSKMLAIKVNDLVFNREKYEKISANLAKRSSEFSFGTYQRKLKHLYEILS